MEFELDIDALTDADADRDCVITTTEADADDDSVADTEDDASVDASFLTVALTDDDLVTLADDNAGESDGDCDALTEIVDDNTVETLDDTTDVDVSAQTARMRLPSATKTYDRSQATPSGARNMAEEPTPSA